jgi:3-oxoacyl-[acyl-carrier-protein] synthase-3
VKLRFCERQIEGLLTIVPTAERIFSEEMSAFNFPIERSVKLAEVMGYNRRRVVDGPACVSDLLVRGFEHLFDSGLIRPDELDALVVVTQTPDYLMPGTSFVIHGRLKLKRDMLCLDINQGCAGFLVGLMQGFSLLDQPSIAKVAIANADVLSRKVGRHDRNSYPLIGDAASITIVSRDTDSKTIHANIKTDGLRREALMIPAGGMREPSSEATRVETTDADGNLRARDNLMMDGAAVFNFVQNEVPPMIEELLDTANVPIEHIDQFVFHQPNKFMLQKLAQKLNVPISKMPSNVVEHFGNSSGVTIPMALTLNLRERLISATTRTVFAGFGVGLTWCSMLADVGPMQFCETINYG